MIVSELDVADLISEREQGYEYPHPDMGRVTYRVLDDPEDARKDLFDAGRLIPDGESESAEMALPSRND